MPGHQGNDCGTLGHAGIDARFTCKFEDAKLAEQTPIWAELSKNHTTDKTMTICHLLTASHLTDLV